MHRSTKLWIISLALCGALFLRLETRWQASPVTPTSAPTPDTEVKRLPSIRSFLPPTPEAHAPADLVAPPIGPSLSQPTAAEPAYTFLGIEDGLARFENERGQLREASAHQILVRMNTVEDTLPETITIRPANRPQKTVAVHPLAPGLKTLGLLYVDPQDYPDYLTSQVESGHTLRPDWVIRAPKPAAIRTTPQGDAGGEPPGISSRWHYDISGLDAYAANITETSEDPIIVAVVDTGIDTTHPQLASQLWINTGEIPDNGIDDDGNGYIDDVHGWNFHHETNDLTDSNAHGTHVAGIIAARQLTPDELAAFPGTPAPASPAAPHVRLMPLKVFGPDDAAYTSDFVAAILYARQNGADIINHSWGSEAFAPDVDDEINRSGRREGIVNIAAAGNDGLDLDYAEGGYLGERNDQYPAELPYDWVYGVASYEPEGNFSDFSNYGSSIDTSAPGGFILSTAPMVLNDEAVEMGGTPGSMEASGTSMAAPNLAVSLSLLMAKNPFLKRQPTLLREYYLKEFHEDRGFEVAGGRALLHPLKDPVALFVIKPDLDRSDYPNWYANSIRIGRSPSLPVFFFVETHRTGNYENPISADIVLTGESVRAVLSQSPQHVTFRSEQRKQLLGYEAKAFNDDPAIEPEVNFAISLNSTEYPTYGSFQGVFPAEDDRYIDDVNYFDEQYSSDDSDGDGITAWAEALFGNDLNAADTVMTDLVHFGVIPPQHFSDKETAYVEVFIQNRIDFSQWIFPFTDPSGGKLLIEMSEDLTEWISVPLSFDNFWDEDDRYVEGTARYYYQTSHWFPQEPAFPVASKRFFRFRYEPNQD